jgi:hypothetical protein
VRGILLKPTLNLLSWMLGQKHGNSLIIGGPLGWSWQATLDEAHHGSLAGPASAHRHSDLAAVGIDDHHPRDHAPRHADGGADEVALDAAQLVSGRFGMGRMPDGSAGYYLKAQGPGADPAYSPVVVAPADASPGDLIDACAPTARSGAQTSMTKVKEIRISRSGAYRVKFDLRALLSGNVYGQVYRNGAAVGTLRSTASTTFVTFSEEIAGWSPGDLCQLYARTDFFRYEVANFIVASGNPWNAVTAID